MGSICFIIIGYNYRLILIGAWVCGCVWCVCGVCGCVWCVCGCVCGVCGVCVWSAVCGVFVCLCVSHSVPKRLKKFQQGALAHSWVYCQRSYSWAGRISRLITVTYLQTKVTFTILLRPWAEAVTRFSLRLLMHVQKVPVADLSLCLCLTWLQSLSEDFTWLRATIIQVCIRRSNSESHSMARLPVWSLRVRAASMTQQMRISYTLVFLPFSLLCSLASRCGHVLDFFSLTSWWPETYSLDGTAPVWTVWISPLQWISLTQKPSASHSLTSLQLLLAAFNYYYASKRPCVCVALCSKETKEIPAGGSSPLMSLLPTKLLTSWEDITADHRAYLQTKVTFTILLHPWARSWAQAL